MKSVIFFFFLCYTFVCNSQQTGYVDFLTGTANISFKPTKKTVSGSVLYRFEIINDVDSVYIDAKQFSAINYVFNHVSYHEYNGEHIIIKNNFKKGEIHEVTIVFSTSPKKAMYFIDWDYEKGNKQIWTQGQGKYTSNWLPSIDDMNDKIEFDLSITFDSDYEVIANGKLINKEINKLNTTWHYNMEKPMSSYLVALAIGKYNKKVEYSKRGVPLEMYYYPKDSLKFEPTYRYTKQLFDFLEDEIGVPYPWQNYKQIPVKDFLYAGMENTSATIFSDAFVIDSIAFVDKNYVNVNAHELAHQWFGNLVTETSGTHHWLQEGFATYYALLAEREIFGDVYYYWSLYEYAQELLKQDLAGGSTALLNPKSSSTTFYKKGAWALHILRERVGDDAFKKGVKNYVLKHQFKNVDTGNFINEIQNTSGEDLSGFVKSWLKSNELHYDEMERFLCVNSIEYKDFLSLRNVKSEKPILDYMESSKNPYIISELIKSLNGKIDKLFFEIDNLNSRQAVAQSTSKIPIEFKEVYETLLNDKSYITIETALFNLWQNYPQERKKYLNQTKGMIGFRDKNIRLLWLTLALVTEGFELENKQLYFDELTEYTSPKYGFEIRQNAFQYLNQIKACNTFCMKNLEQAAKHHNWRFSKFAKSLLKAN